MIHQLIIIIGLLWVILAVAVGSHARGHNRSGILWFSFVLVTGIFGLAFYLLAITSNSAEPIAGRSLDDKIISKGPRYLIASIVGTLGVGFLGFVFAAMTSNLTRPPFSEPGPAISPLDPLLRMVLWLALLSGAAGGFYVAHKRGIKRVAYYLTYLPFVFAGLGAPRLLFSTMGFEGGDFHGNVWVPPVFFLLGSVIGGILWNRAYHSVIRDRVYSQLKSWNKPDSISLSRRRVLSLTGATVTLAGGGYLYRETRPELRIVNTKGIFDSEEPVVVVKMNNPKTESATVEIDAEISYHHTNAMGEGFITIISESKIETISPDSSKEVRIRFENAETPSGEEFGPDYEVNEVSFELV